MAESSRVPPQNRTLSSFFGKEPGMYNFGPVLICIRSGNLKKIELAEYIV